MTARTPLHRGAPNRHDRECGSRWCHICRHVGAHTPDGIAARKRRDRRGHLSDTHEARKAGLLGEVAAVTRLRVVEGGAG